MKSNAIAIVISIIVGLVVFFNILTCKPTCNIPNTEISKPYESHAWCMWLNEWDKTNAQGFMRQTRHCTVCGLHETRTSH